MTPHESLSLLSLLVTEYAAMLASSGAKATAGAVLISAKTHHEVLAKALSELQSAKVEG